MAKPTEVHASQEVLLFDGPLQIVRGYSQEIARRGKISRQKRKGYLSLSGRTTGFLRRVGGLWIPASGTENTAVVKIPEKKVDQDAEFIRGKVLEKYEATDVPQGRIDLWAYFASSRVRQGLRLKFNEFMNSSAVDAIQLEDGLTRDNEVIREHVEESEIARGALAKYVIHLEAFVGEPEIMSDKTNRRKWPQPRNQKDYAERERRAHNFIDQLPTHQFHELFVEAYASAVCRHRFWQGVYTERKRYEKARRSLEPDYVEVPIEAYENSPEAW